MWPQSRGSSGSRLKTPTKKFRTTSRFRKIHQAPCSTVSPPSRLAPTTLIGVFGSRGLPLRASTSAGTRWGIRPTAPPIAANSLPVKMPDCFTDSTGPYVTVRGRPGGASQITPSAGTGAGLALLPSSGVRIAPIRYTLNERVWLPRLTVRLAGARLAARIALCRSSYVLTDLPLNEVITSPSCRPARLAGDSGSLAAQPVAVSLAGTQSLTVTIAGCFAESYAGLGTPTKLNVIHSTMKPRTKWVTEPATITTVRFQSGNVHIARSSSASSSCGVIPTIFTKPPSGMALRPYSVSPRWKDHRVGPKPAKYRVTFIPNRLAVSM